MDEFDEIAIMKRVSKGGGKWFIGKAIGYVLTLFSTVVLARLLMPYNYGLLSLGLTIVGTLALFGDLGLGSAIVFYIPKFQTQKNLEKVKWCIKNSFIIKGALSGVFSLIIFLGAGFIANNIYHNSALFPVLQVLAPAIFLFTLILFFPYIFQGFQRLEFSMHYEILFAIGKFLPPILVIAGLGLIGAAMGVSISYFAVSIVLFFLLFRYLYPRGASQKVEIQPFIHYAIYAYGIAILALFYNQLSSLLLGFFYPKNLEQVAYFSVAIAIGLLIYILPASLASALLPAISELNALKDGKKMKSICERTMKYIIYLSVPAGIAMIVLGRQVISLVYGARYLPAEMSLIIVSIAAVFMGVSTTVQSLAFGIGKSDTLFRVSAGQAAAGAVSSLLLIPVYGAFGASLAYLITQFVGMVMTIILTSRHFKICLPYKAISFAIICSFFMALPLLLIRIYVHGLVKLPFSVFIGLMTYFMLLYKMGGLDDVDKDIVRIALKKFNLLPVRK